MNDVELWEMKAGKVTKIKYKDEIWVKDGQKTLLDVQTQDKEYNNIKPDKKPLEPTKYCQRCKTVKPVSEFNPSKDTKDGLRCYCKTCNNELNRQYTKQKKEKHQEVQDEIPTYKICTKCGIEKPITEFNKDHKGKDGKRSQCRQCDLAYQKRYQERQKMKALSRKEIKDYEIITYIGSHPIRYEPLKEMVKTLSKKKYVSRKQLEKILLSYIPYTKKSLTATTASYVKAIEKIGHIEKMQKGINLVYSFKPNIITSSHKLRSVDFKEEPLKKQKQDADHNYLKALFGR